MKKLFTLLCTICISATIMFAEDIIVTKDSQRINAQIEEVTLDAVKYHRSDNPNGPLYTLPKSDISSIIYENGLVDVFETKPSRNGRVNYADSETIAALEIFDGTIYHNGKALSNEEYVMLLNKCCPAAYEQYKKGKTLSITGWAFLGTGVSMMLGIGVPSYYLGLKKLHNARVFYTGLSMLAFGSSVVATSVPLLCVGYKIQKASVKTFNRGYATDITYNITVGQNGVGLAINF